MAIALTGGFSFRFGGSRMTARSPDRAALAAIAVVALRLAIDRRTRPLAEAPPARPPHPRPLYSRAQDSVVARTSRARHGGLARLPAAGFCVFAAVLLFPQLQRMDSVPDLGDPLFSIWRSGWVYHKLGGDPRPLFSPNIFHPHR